MIKVEIKIQDNGVIQKLSNLFPAVADVAIPYANDELIDTLKEGSPPYTYVSMQEAGGWASEKQRRFVMANIASGNIVIPYGRTGQLESDWKTKGEGRKQYVVNDNPVAKFVYGPRQSTMMRLRNWPDVVTGFSTVYLSTVVNAFKQGVKNAVGNLFGR